MGERRQAPFAKELRLLANGQRREVSVFDRVELLKLIRRRDPNEDGEVAARAFDMFGEGRPVREVVIALRQTPERVELLHDQWNWSGGCELVINPAAKRELESVLGPFVGVADVVERVVELARKVARQGREP